ncbi:hypothetical protein [Bacteroides ihuae]|nr:hypothetical protein [Bacteroides ihuae]
MKNEKEENKQVWETPEIIDLDVNKDTELGAGSSSDAILGS